MELPGAGLGRMITINSEAAIEAGRASVKMWENMNYGPKILALPLLLPLPDFWPPRYKLPPRFSDLSTPLNLIKISYTTSWGCWKHLFGIPGVRLMFLKPKLHKESKNGFKTINYRPYPVMIFSKNCFKSKKSSKKLDILLILNFYCNIYG